MILFQPEFIDSDEGNEFLDLLLENILWDGRDLIFHGKARSQPRLVAWYGPLPYTYSGLTLEAAEIPNFILPLKAKIEDYITSLGKKVTFNSVFLNLYRNGSDSVNWHSDDNLPTPFDIFPTIASISLGEERKFEMKQKNKSERSAESDLSIQLTHGSLMIMNDVMRCDWQRRTPKDNSHMNARICLTFRTIYLDERLSELVELVDKSKILGIDSCIEPSVEKDLFNADDFPKLKTLPSSKSVKKEVQPTEVRKKSFPVDGVNSKDREFSDVGGSDNNKIIEKESAKYDSDDSDPLFMKQFKSKMYADQIQSVLNVNVKKPSFMDSKDREFSDVGGGDNNKILEKESAKYDSDDSDPLFMKQFKIKMYADQIQPILNINATEFARDDQSPASSEKECFDKLNFGDLFNKLSFEELIACEVDASDKQDYLNFTNALMKKIMENLPEFKSFQQEEILFIADLMENNRCPLTDKFCRARLCVLAKKLNNEGFKLCSKNKFSCNLRDKPSHLRDLNKQRQTLHKGKTQNCEENYSQEDRVSTASSRSYEGRDDLTSSPKEKSLHKKDQRKVSHKNPNKNSRDHDTWDDEKNDLSNVFKNKEVDREEDGSSENSSMSEMINRWLEADLSCYKVGNSEDVLGEDCSKGEGTSDEDCGVNDYDSPKNSESSGDDVNNADHRKRNIDGRDQSKKSNWRGRHSDQNEHFDRRDESFQARNRLEATFDQGGRNFNSRKWFGPQNVDSSEQPEDKAWETENMPSGSKQENRSSRGDKIFSGQNGSEPRNHLDQRDGKYKHRNSSYRPIDFKQRSDHLNWDTDSGESD